MIRRAFPFAALLALLAPLSAAACGDDEVHNKDFGSPPDGPGFDPGSGAPAGGGYGSGGSGAGGSGTSTYADPPPPPPGVYDWRDAVMYFVFVDRFFNGDTANDCAVAGADASGTASGNYEGGDWIGVKQKIDEGYFTSLGVNTLWITVPFKNADAFAGAGVSGDAHRYAAYHGYWPLDPGPSQPIQPEPCFGSMSDLTALVAAAHGKGLKVLFDYAMVHVQKDSPVYKDHADWFFPATKPGGGDCICGQGCSWQTDYAKCWFADYLPHWNYANAAARAYSVANAVSWASQMGVDGFRLDAIKHVDPSWLTQLRADVQSKVIAKQPIPQRFYMVGETYDFEDRDFIKSFVDPSKKLDGQFDFPLRKRIVESIVMRRGAGMNDLAAFMDSNEWYYGVDAVMSTFIGNHDLPRIIHEAADTPLWASQDDDGKGMAWSSQPSLPATRAPFERVANAFALLLTNKGAPLLYYGDEIGLPGAGDPDNRRAMPWTGLTADQTFLRDRVRTLTAIRAAHPALRRGHRTTLAATSDVWVYSMRSGSDVVTVAINRGDVDQPVATLPRAPLAELVAGADVTGPSATIPARQTRIFANR